MKKNHIIKQIMVVFILFNTFIKIIPMALANENYAISTLSVIQITLNATQNCLHYKIIGLCFWLDCHAGICTTNTTLKVNHYLPDVVVSVFQKSDSNPWDFGNTVLDTVAKPIGNTQIKNILKTDMGHGNEQTGSDKDQDTHFKEADLVGNPTISLFNKFKHFLIYSEAIPFTPYYLSMADSYAWRSPLIETALYPHSLIPGVHIVGSLQNNWGNVYPRTGFILQINGNKAAAVIAQRAADIATQSKPPQSHVYKLLSNDCGKECKVFEIKENYSSTQWQMIYPSSEKTCGVFGENDLDNIPESNGNYAWVLWQHYQGYIQGEGKYMGSISF